IESNDKKQQQNSSTDDELESAVDQLSDDEDVAAGGDRIVQVEEHEEAPQAKETIPSTIAPKQKEIEIGRDAKVIEISSPKKAELEQEQEEVFVKKEEIKLKSAPVPHITMPSKKKVLEHEQVKIPEEPTPTKVLDTPLSLDITAQMSPAAFSWSEEMEKNLPFRNWAY
uniref:Uncharacterized protein n=1 Tax=Caenorhabditis japonica TaxID=281687 RepID=A0A8R1EVT2_CAEJA